jgi:hypothetical protein
MGGPLGAAKVLYAFGRHSAVGCSTMGIEDPRLPQPDYDVIGSYDLITQLVPLITEDQGKGTMSAVMLLGPNDPPQKIQLGNYTLEVAKPMRATDIGSRAGVLRTQEYRKRH